MSEKIPQGSYAVPLTDQRGQVIGYSVYRKPDTGPLKRSLLDAGGRVIDVFKDVDVVFTHEDLLRAHADGDQGEHLAQISENPEQFAINFGLTTGRCGVCNRPLSNPKSLSRGIGPECSQKLRGYGSIQ